MIRYGFALAPVAVLMAEAVLDAGAAAPSNRPNASAVARADLVLASENVIETLREQMATLSASAMNPAKLDRWVKRFKPPYELAELSEAELDDFTSVVKFVVIVVRPSASVSAWFDDALVVPSMIEFEPVEGSIGIVWSIITGPVPSQARTPIVPPSMMMDPSANEPVSAPAHTTVAKVIEFMFCSLSFLLPEWAAHRADRSCASTQAQLSHVHARGLLLRPPLGRTLHRLSTTTWSADQDNSIICREDV